MRNILFVVLLLTAACTTKTPETKADSTITVTDSIRHGKPDSTKF